MDSKLQWVSSPLCSGIMCRVSLTERAKEELEILEYHQPNKFSSLKMELKALISEFEAQLNNSTSASSAATQESSSWKKRKKDDSLVGEEAGKAEASTYNSGSKRKCKTDAVLERAQKCLDKVRKYKTSFLQNADSVATT